MKLAIRIDQQDNIAMAMEALGRGETVSVLSDQATEIDRIQVGQEIALPFHKIALKDIPKGAPVYKYGVVIGYASVAIGRGDWVHLHNLESASFHEMEAAGGKSS